MTVDPNNGGAYVQITLSKVYDEVTGARRELQDLVSTVRPMASQLVDHEQRIRYGEQHGATKDDVDRVIKRIDERIDPRITSLERWRWAAGGVITVLSTTGGAFLGKLISKS